MEELSELVAKAKNGDKESFDRLYALTQNDVWFTCISLLKNEENAKDAMQNTYITAFLKLSTLNEPSKFTSWIKKIAVNKCKDFLKTRQDVQLDEEMLENFSETDEVTVPDEYINNSEKRNIILKLMKDTLSDVQYQAVFMYYFDDMSIPEIAEATDCPEGTVMSRLNLARAKMKKAITDYEKKNDDKLHSFVPIPLFVSLFRTESKGLTVPTVNIDFSHAQGSNVQEIKHITGSGGKNMFKSTISKVIAGACAVAVVGGGITAAIIIGNQNKPVSTSGEVSVNSSVSAVSQGSTENGESTNETEKAQFLMEDTVLFESEKCKVTIKNPEYRTSDDRPCLDFHVEIENKTSDEVLRTDIDTERIYVNGYNSHDLGRILSLGVDPKKTRKDPFYIYLDEVEKYKLTSINEIAFRLYVYNEENDNDKDKYYCNEMKYIYPTGVTKVDVKIPERITTEKEKLIFDNEYANAVYLGFEKTKSEWNQKNYYILNFYVENKTDKPCDCDLYINKGEYSIIESGRVTIEGNMRVYKRLVLNEQDYETAVKGEDINLKVYIGDVGNTANFEGVSTDKSWYKDTFDFSVE